MHICHSLALADSSDNSLGSTEKRFRGAGELQSNTALVVLAVKTKTKFAYYYCNKPDIHSTPTVGGHIMQW